MHSDKLNVMYAAISEQFSIVSRNKMVFAIKSIILDWGTLRYHHYIEYLLSYHIPSNCDNVNNKRTRYDANHHTKLNKHYTPKLAKSPNTPPAKLPVGSFGFGVSISVGSCILTVGTRELLFCRRLWLWLFVLLNRCRVIRRGRVLARSRAEHIENVCQFFNLLLHRTWLVISQVLINSEDVIGRYTSRDSRR